MTLWSSRARAVSPNPVDRSVVSRRVTPSARVRLPSGAARHDNVPPRATRRRRWISVRAYNGRGASSGPVNRDRVKNINRSRRGMDRDTRPPATTVSTIAVRSGATRIVIALLQVRHTSLRWFAINTSSHPRRLVKCLIVITDLLAAAGSHPARPTRRVYIISVNTTPSNSRSVRYAYLYLYT